jgi:N-acetylneuraminate synthase
MSLSQPEVLFIAEVSANHLGSFDRAKEIVHAASKAGATAVKFQTYTAETMTLDIENFSVSKGHDLWGGRRLFSLYQEAFTPWEWHDELFKLSRSLGLIPFSSPFDLTAVEFLESINAPMYKIASLETGDHRLINAVASTGKPLIISTGATEWDEIVELVEVVKKTGNKDLTLMVCTSSYPADPSESHVNRIATLRKEFGCKVGLSDHTLGIGASVAAIALGAVAIEKHLTLKRSDGGADGAFSMEPHEFAQLVTEGNVARQSLGDGSWRIQASEFESRRLRRTLYVVENVNKGDLVTHQNVKAIRPGGGAHPRHLDSFIGKRFDNAYGPGTPMSYEILQDQ